MILEMYINNKLVDRLPLSLHKINVAEERIGYMQGAIDHLMEIWDESIVELDVKPEFLIKPSFDGRNHFFDKT